MIVELTKERARFIAHRLRPSWGREVAAGLPGYGTPDELDAWADRMASMPCRNCCVATPDGDPAVMGGIIQSAHMGITWLAGTHRVEEVAAEFMREVLRAHRELERAGVRRFAAHCLAGPDELFTWLGKLGYKREGEHPGMGVHGETYISFGKVVNHVHGR